ncbi:hypothetical protein BCV72DRAFT_219160 [Rhizopus microsporus var. microsporus]|uniref:RxLR effector protein n=2 Tax=Rhizopus microsporus TaxID=58291 RepID=A0A2G4T9L0_RHIZD|nr:uncharacterized protein RHIMIDRAFT_254623 [Rhizopus microsporus ATCC 52813]ORE11883.1 hypothetical protein BCV72DRAFT_219160 [Rhizopus microsporus var. microsporus]PHZ17701.1 hypothetical protein RHIMIDRAFT_254623 [Rhizopus microsporus ATCC 52813]
MRSTFIFLALAATLALVSAVPSNPNDDIVRRVVTLAKKSNADAIYRRTLNREALLGESRFVRRDEEDEEDEEDEKDEKDEKDEEDEQDEDDKDDEDEQDSASLERRGILEGLGDELDVDI